MTSIRYISLGDAERPRFDRQLPGDGRPDGCRPGGRPGVRAGQASSRSIRASRSSAGSRPQVRVTLDPIKTQDRDSRSASCPGPTPSGLDVRPAVVDARDRRRSPGPASVVDQVVEVQANVVDRADRPRRRPRRRADPGRRPGRPAHAGRRRAADRPRHDRGLQATPNRGRCRSRRSSPARRPPATRSTGDRRRSARSSRSRATPTRSSDLAEAPTEPVSVNGATQDVVQDGRPRTAGGRQPAGGAGRDRHRDRHDPSRSTGSRSYDAGIIPSGIAGRPRLPPLDERTRSPLVGGSDRRPRPARRRRRSPCSRRRRRPRARARTSVTLTANLPVGPDARHASTRRPSPSP